MIRIARCVPWILLLPMLWGAVPSFAHVFRCTDAGDKVRYSDTPCDGSSAGAALRNARSAADASAAIAARANAQAAMSASSNAAANGYERQLTGRVKEAIAAGDLGRADDLAVTAEQRKLVNDARTRDVYNRCAVIRFQMRQAARGAGPARDTVSGRTAEIRNEADYQRLNCGG